MPGFRSACLCLATVILFAAPCAAMTLEEFTTKVIVLSAQEPDGPDKAIELCDKALAGFAGDDAEYIAAVLAFKSQAFRLKDDFTGAEAEARESLRFNPDSPLGHFMLTDALNEQKRFDEARESCLKGASLMEKEYQEYMGNLCEEAYAFNTAPQQEQPGEEPQTMPDTGTQPEGKANPDEKNS